MKTEHHVLFSDSSCMSHLSDRSVDLIVTSPPYPMIEMWDKIFSDQSSSVRRKLEKGDGPGAYESMHRLLDPVWKESFRVLKPGRFVCINVGDATRTINGHFALYTNHARILKYTQELGFSSLPYIIWRKQTNAPSKFMGSGMLPAGAYVTLEHEYILILRKGPKREFKKDAEKLNRHESAMFWEERNSWFSDIWFDIKGAPQSLKSGYSRKRSAAWPFELVYRLINMYSVKGDLVLDPFLGTGTTMGASVALGRNSIGYEIDKNFGDAIYGIKNLIVDISRQVIRKRLAGHLNFVLEYSKTGKLKYNNIHYGFPVITSQERNILFNEPLRVSETGKGLYDAEYFKNPDPEWFRGLEPDSGIGTLGHEFSDRKPRQMTLF